MKKIIAIVMAALLVLCFASCKEKTPVERADVRVTALKGPTGMGMASLMAENENGTTQNNYTFSLASAPAEVQSTIISGNFDIAAERYSTVTSSPTLSPFFSRMKFSAYSGVAL